MSTTPDRRRVLLGALLAVPCAFEACSKHLVSAAWEPDERRVLAGLAQTSRHPIGSRERLEELTAWLRSRRFDPVRSLRRPLEAFESASPMTLEDVVSLARAVGGGRTGS